MAKNCDLSLVSSGMERHSTCPGWEMFDCKQGPWLAVQSLQKVYQLGCHINQKQGNIDVRAASIVAQEWEWRARPARCQVRTLPAAPVYLPTPRP